LTWFYYLLTVALAYLIGSSNMAVYLARAKGVDLRGGGSGNPGTSNALILMGWKAGVLVGAHDIGKAVLAVVLAKHFLPALPFIGAVAGVACVLGHIFPFYLRFRGGKGFAAYVGMTIALNWKFALVVVLAIVVVTLVTDYIVAGTVLTTVAVPTYLGLAQHSLPLALILLVATATILIKHRENFVRILNGTEIGFRRANRGDDRKV